MIYKKTSYLHCKNLPIYNNDLVNRLTRTPVYYADSSNKSADDLLDGVALIPMGTDCNSNLQSLLSGTFAYVITIIYATNISQATTTSRRVQIAMSYNSIPAKMAIRLYGGSGWTEWQRLASLSDLSSVTVTSCTSATYSSTANYAKSSGTASKATSATSATYSSTANYAKNIPTSLITNNAFPIPTVGYGSLPNTNLNSCRTNIIVGFSENDLPHITNLPSNMAGIFRSQICGTYCLQEYFVMYEPYGKFRRMYGSLGWSDWINE